MAVAQQLCPGRPGLGSMSAPVIKGWCPGAHRPMMSGDGLVVRVRPFCGALSRDQALGLSQLAERFGNGMLDLTSRANLQIRGVSETAFPVLLAELDALGLIDADPAIEQHRNILVPPRWMPGDLTHRMHDRLVNVLPRLPALPQKMGFAIDLGHAACLRDGSADFRFELDPAGALLLRADGAAAGRLLSEDDVEDALIALATWFTETGGPAHGRMARHLQHVTLPQDWCTLFPRAQEGPVPVDLVAEGAVLGAPFGKIDAVDLRAVIQDHAVSQIHMMLGRLLFFPGVQTAEATGFVSPTSRLMQVHACPGAPFCPQATVATFAVAETLAGQTDGSLHVSGCAKGCAFPRKAHLTMVGRNGVFDLVTDGQPWDEPCQQGLDPARASELASFT